MKSVIKSDVIVIGAGPVGLTVACELRLAGLQVAVLERRPGPVTQSRALTMHGRTLEMLALRGMADRFVSHGMKLPTGHFAMLDTRLDFSRIDTTFPFTLFIPQGTTEQLLEAWAMEIGVELHRQTTAGQIVEDENGVQVTAMCGDESRCFSAPYLIGADGARSVVRQHAGIAFDGTPATQTVMMGDVCMSNPPPQRLLGLDNAAGGLAVVPLSAEVQRIIITDVERMHVPTNVPVTLDELQVSARRVAGQDFGMHTPQWLSRFGNEARLAESYRKGRVFLVGDAAHIHFPAGGQGMNVGMQDAMNLGWKLAGVMNGHASLSLLDSYHAERHPVGLTLLQNTLAQSVLLMNCFDAAGQALRQTMSELIKIPALNNALALNLSAFGVGYPEALVHTPSSWLPNQAWAGRRLPNWSLRMEDGRCSSLYPSLQSGKWLVLQLTSQGASFSPPLDGAWFSTIRAMPEGREAELAGVDALLIRPDGHVDQAVSSTLKVEAA